MNREILIEVINLDFAYEKELVLNNINFTIKKGDFHALIGPNGGGKSTLIKIILGLLKPVNGSVKLFDGKIHDNINKVGYIPQNIRDENFPVTVLDVLKMGFDIKRDYATNLSILEEVINQLKLELLINKQISELSGGQRQRVFIGRALTGKPELLLLDEPTSSIDTEGQTKIYKILKELNKKITIIVVSHDLNVIVKYANSISVVNKTACYHNKPVLTKEIMDVYYQCPFEILTQSIKEI
ncbi:MAG: ABC transporter ATP-binding protein [Candidatus Muirbacterium halophilum]|nr:ABC transporter ATP-binding protein [Candidatus Muirbacterium halophilum]MCK9476037.1 ABC transporter ATP-binding protein [Candidatus Muirbacterium halophilum]